MAYFAQHQAPARSGISDALVSNDTNRIDAIETSESHHDRDY